MGDDVRVDAFGLQGRIIGGVGTTVHTGETPIGRGELECRRRPLRGATARSWKSTAADCCSTPRRSTIRASTSRRAARSRPSTVGLNVRGTLQEPRLTFFSDPSMPQTQIMSYLLTGKSVDSMHGQRQRTSISAARDSLAVQGGGFLASQLGRRIGLEEVGVESSVDSAGEANTALVLGKFLSPRCSSATASR